MASRKTFWGAMFQRREKFSLEELEYLYEQLLRYPVVTEANREVVVETLREIAELMIWGDQHEPRFFDFFLEKQVLALFLRLLSSSSNRRGGVAQQFLQTLSIMIQNIRSEEALFYLFSNNHINNLISYRFDFADEEILAFYISFLRTISMKLNLNTIQFFFQSHATPPTCPLYTEAIKFVRHEEVQVRIAVRTLTLNVYTVARQDPALRDFIVSREQRKYFVEVVSFLRRQLLDHDVYLPAAKRGEVGKLSAAADEAGDLMSYCNDVLLIGCEEISQALLGALLDGLVLPVLLASLLPEPYAPEPGEGLKPLTCLHLLARFFGTFTAANLVNQVAICLLLPPLPASATSGPPAAASASGASLPSVSEEEAPKPQQPPPHNEGAGEENLYRRAFLELLTEGDAQTCAAACSVVVAIASNKEVDADALDALGLAPQLKRKKRDLFASLTRGDSDVSNGLFGSTNGASTSLAESPLLPSLRKFLQHRQAYLLQEAPAEVKEATPEQQPALGDDSATVTAPLTEQDVQDAEEPPILRQLSHLQQLQRQGSKDGDPEDVDPQTDDDKDDGDGDKDGQRAQLADDSPLTRAEFASAQQTFAYEPPEDDDDTEELAGAALGPTAIDAAAETAATAATTAAGTGSADPGDVSAAAAALALDDAANDSQPERAADTAGSTKATGADALEAARSCVSYSLDSAPASYAVVHALYGVVTRQQAGFNVEALQEVAWLAVQLRKMPSEKTRGDAHYRLVGVRARLEEAEWQARQALTRELVGPWCDLLAQMLQEEWCAAQRLLKALGKSTPSALDALLPTLAPPSHAHEYELSSGMAADRARMVVYIFALLRQLRLVCAGAATHGAAIEMDELPPSEPPLEAWLEQGGGLLQATGEIGAALQGGGSSPVRGGQSIAAAAVAAAHVREGTEVDLGGATTHALPCRVAFERGQERHVLLVVAAASSLAHSSPGVSASRESLQQQQQPAAAVLLVEPAAHDRNLGVVKAVAALAGAQPLIDPSHPKWLHVKVRSPLHWHTKRRRAADGRWTLAFAEEARCASAKRYLDDQAEALRQCCEAGLRVMCGDGATDEGQQ